jgi:MYXO-CTERM domain-containing protein
MTAAGTLFAVGPLRRHGQEEDRMKLKSIAAAAAFFALPTATLAQDNVSETNVAVPADPPAAETNVTIVSPAPAPAPRETIVTTTTPVAVPPIDDPLSNPYANSYNELLPLEPEEDRGFDDWGLLGLLGLFGLFGLRRRERLVYVEPAHVHTPTRTVTREAPPPADPIA